VYSPIFTKSTVSTAIYCVNIDYCVISGDIINIIKFIRTIPHRPRHAEWHRTILNHWKYIGQHPNEHHTFGGIPLADPDYIMHLPTTDFITKAYGTMVHHRSSGIWMFRPTRTSLEVIATRHIESGHSTITLDWIQNGLSLIKYITLQPYLKKMHSKNWGTIPETDKLFTVSWLFSGFLCSGYGLFGPLPLFGRILWVTNQLMNMRVIVRRTYGEAARALSLSPFLDLVSRALCRQHEPTNIHTNMHRMYGESAGGCLAFLDLVMWPSWPGSTLGSTLLRS